MPLLSSSCSTMCVLVVAQRIQHELIYQRKIGSLTRLLSLSVYILNKTGNAENKVKSL